MAVAMDLPCVENEAVVRINYEDGFEVIAFLESPSDAFDVGEACGGLHHAGAVNNCACPGFYNLCEFHEEEAVPAWWKPLEAFLWGCVMWHLGETECFLKLVEFIKEISAVSVALFLYFFDAQVEQMLVYGVGLLGELTAI